MQCPTCGGSVRVHTKFCTQCGTALGETIHQVQTDDAQRDADVKLSPSIEALTIIDTPLPPLGQSLPVLRPHQKLDINLVRHPTENLFLTIIFIFNVIVLLFLVAAFFGFAAVPWIIIGLTILSILLEGISYVFFYWLIYGNSVLVSSSQYTDIYKAVQRACEFIELKPMPRIFVKHGAGLLEIFLIKRFTSRGVLIFTSETVETLLASEDSRQLMMVIGRQLGHIKAGHYQWWFFKDVVGRFSLWFYTAWKRRCHFTADRIGFLIAGDLDASRKALLTITVGSRLASITNIDALREQDSELRSNFFSWLRYIHSDYPYMIYRIMELETFQHIAQQQPAEPSGERVVGFLPSSVSRFDIDDKQHLRQLLNVHQRRLHVLELKTATYGINSPAEIMLEIEDLTKEIRRIELQINRPKVQLS